MAVSELWRLIERDRGSQPMVVTVHEATLSPVEVAANSIVSEALAVPGVVASDICIAVVPAGDTGTFGGFYVSAVDEITVVFDNPTGSAVTPDSGTWKFVTIT